MPTGLNHITLLLPAGLTPERYHALAGSLVDAFGVRPHTEATFRSAGRPYLILSEIERAPSKDAVILNDATWTLSMPVPAGTDLDALTAAARQLPGGAGIEIEAAGEYRTSTPET